MKGFETRSFLIYFKCYMDFLAFCFNPSVQLELFSLISINVKSQEIKNEIFINYK